MIVCTSLVLFGCSNASLESGDESEVKNLLTEYSNLSPAKLGGPKELKNVKAINSIDVGQIVESKWTKMGCKDCKDTDASINATTAYGTTETITYQVRKMDGKWMLTGFKNSSGERGNFYPFLDLDVIKARASL